VRYDVFPDSHDTIPTPTVAEIEARLYSFTDIAVEAPERNAGRTASSAIPTMLANASATVSPTPTTLTRNAPASPVMPTLTGVSEASPTTAPSTTAIRVRMIDSAQIIRSTWPRVAPIIRINANSRDRSLMDITSVLNAARAPNAAALPM